MVKVLNRRIFPPGHIVFLEGSKGNQAYVVQSGVVQIQKENPDGEKIILGTIRQGGIFGEMALIDNSNRMATAITMDHTVCITIPESILRQKLRRTDPVVKMLLVVLIRMIRTVAEHGSLEPEAVDQLMEAADDEEFYIEIGEEQSNR